MSTNYQSAETFLPSRDSKLRRLRLTARVLGLAAIELTSHCCGTGVFLNVYSCSADRETYFLYSGYCKLFTIKK
jgi:hypothetical protein